MFRFLKKILPPSSPSASVDVIAQPVTAMDLGDGQSHQTRGNEFLAEGKFEQAAECYRQVIATTPNSIGGYCNLGYALTEMKKPAEAMSVLQQAAVLDPVNVDVYYMLAKLARDNGKQDDAIRHFEKVLALKPDFETAYVELCDVLDQGGRDDDARSVIAKGIKRFPNVARYHYILGKLHAKAKAHAQAVTCFKQAILLEPNYANLHFDLAASMYAEGRLEDAIDSLRFAIARKPDYADAYGNLGTLLIELDGLDEALECFCQAIRYKPDHADFHFNESLCRLRIGDYELGWQQYEWRWKDERFKKSKREFAQPLWSGKESLANKTILLHPEQGLGDTIQFCRYATLLAEEGATVFLLVPKALRSLVSGIKGVSQIFEIDRPLPQFDFHCPLLSLPLAFGTTVATVPATVPYLFALPELTDRIRGELGSDASFRIGLCWKGNRTYPKDADRSPGIGPFATLISSFAASSTKFYTLLPDSREIFRNAGGEDIGYELDQNTPPFAETAALIANLDLVITCDTSIGHIAGALGKAVWIVLPFSPDWRWIRDREDSPWYPRTRLFHQNVRGDWSELFQRVEARLNEVVSGSSKIIWPLNKPV